MKLKMDLYLNPNKEWGCQIFSHRMSFWESIKFVLFDRKFEVLLMKGESEE